ncbi:starch branching enzyme 2.1, partial [Striga asiatica]
DLRRSRKFNGSDKRSSTTAKYGRHCRNCFNDKHQEQRQIWRSRGVRALLGLGSGNFLFLGPLNIGLGFLHPCNLSFNSICLSSPAKIITTVEFHSDSRKACLIYSLRMWNYGMRPDCSWRRAKILIDNLRNQLTQTNGDQKSSKTLLNLAYEPNTEEYQPVVPDKDSTEQIPITKISLAKFLGLQCTGSLVSDPSNNEKEDMRESVVLSCRVGHSRRNPPSSVSRNCLQLRDPNGCADKTGAEDRADPSTAGRREVADLSHRLWPHNHRYPSGASEIHQCVVSINPSGHSSHCLVALSPSTLSPWLPSLTSAFCRSQPSSPIMEPVNREKNSVKMERVLSCRTSM